MLVQGHHSSPRTAKPLAKKAHQALNQREPPRVGPFVAQSLVPRHRLSRRVLRHLTHSLAELYVLPPQRPSRHPTSRRPKPLGPRPTNPREVGIPRVRCQQDPRPPTPRRLPRGSPSPRHRHTSPPLEQRCRQQPESSGATGHCHRLDGWPCFPDPDGNGPGGQLKLIILCTVFGPQPLALPLVEYALPGHCMHP